MARSGYREWAPPPDLSPLAACIWIGRVGDPDVAYTDRVLPDGCVDLIWDGVEPFVAGPDTGPVPIRHTAPTTFVGVRMRPGCAPSLLACPASEARDRRLRLAELWGRPRTAELSDALAAAPDERSIAALLEGAVRWQIAAAPPRDTLVDGLIRALRVRGAVSMGRVAALAADLGVTERSLLRRCVAAIGYGPKTLDRILRFRRAQHFARRATSVDLAAVAAAAGYADQAHLTRECKRLSGLTPARLFALADPVVRDGVSESFNTDERQSGRLAP